MDNNEKTIDNQDQNQNQNEDINSGENSNQQGQQGNNSNNQQSDSDKETKKYNSILDTIAQVVGGKANLKPTKKLSADSTAQVVADLFKEEQAELEVATKQGLKDLLKKHIEVESEISKKEKELKDLQLKKRKEFTQAAQNWLQRIDQASINQASYAKALDTAIKSIGEFPVN